MKQNGHKKYFILGLIASVALILLLVFNYGKFNEIAIAEQLLESLNRRLLGSTFKTDLKRSIVKPYENNKYMVTFIDIDWIIKSVYDDLKILFGSKLDYVWDKEIDYDLQIEEITILYNPEATLIYSQRMRGIKLYFDFTTLEDINESIQFGDFKVKKIHISIENMILKDFSTFKKSYRFPTNLENIKIENMIHKDFKSYQFPTNLENIKIEVIGTNGKDELSTVLDVGKILNIERGIEDGYIPNFLLRKDAPPPDIAKNLLKWLAVTDFNMELEKIKFSIKKNGIERLSNVMDNFSFSHFIKPDETSTFFNFGYNVDIKNLQLSIPNKNEVISLNKFNAMLSAESLSSETVSLLLEIYKKSIELKTKTDDSKVWDTLLKKMKLLDEKMKSSQKIELSFSPSKNGFGKRELKADIHVKSLIFWADAKTTLDILKIDETLKKLEETHFFSSSILKAIMEEIDNHTLRKENGNVYITWEPEPDQPGKNHLNGKTRKEPSYKLFTSLWILSKFVLKNTEWIYMWNETEWNETEWNEKQSSPSWVRYIILFFIIITACGIMIYYLRFFLHPLTIQLSRSPKSIMLIPIEKLPKVQHLLNKTRRLDIVLFKNDIAINIMEGAIHFWKSKDSEVMANLLINRIGEILETLHIDSIRIFNIRLFNSFILNIDKGMIAFMPEALPTEMIIETLKKIKGINFTICIIISTDKVQRENLRKATCDFNNWFITPESQDITKWMLSPEPVKAVSHIISSQVNPSRISPYQASGGVNRESIFFGRDQLLNQIVNQNPANFFLTGGRQIGKSTILKAIERRCREKEGIDCFYIVLAGENLIQRMAYTLKLEHADIDAVISHLHKISENRTLLFLIDETDKFVESDAKTGYKVLNQLRSLSEEGKCFFILAGFWTLYRYAIFEYQSPIKNFGETLQIGALEPDACRELATVPMEHLNIKYESEMLVDKIIKETGQRANLIAIVCNELIKNIDLKNRIITEKDIQNALSGETVLNALGGWEIISENDDKVNQLDRVIIYAGIGIEPFSQKDIMQALNDIQFPFNPEEIREALVRLELAFILEQQQMMYSFRVPVFKKMIQKREPEYMLKMEMRSIL